MAGQGLDAQKRRHSGLVFWYRYVMLGRLWWAKMSCLPIYNPGHNCWVTCVNSQYASPFLPSPLINDFAGIFCLYKQSPKLKQQHWMRREREERAHFKTSKNAALLLLHEHVFLISILSNVLRFHYFIFYSVTGNITFFKTPCMLIRET